MPMVQNLLMREGEDRVFTLYARDWSNLPLSLTGASIEWRVGKPPYNTKSSCPTFTKGATVTDSANGVMQVAVSAADTLYRFGDYRHELWVTISALTSLACEGRLRIGSYIQTGG